MIVESVAILLIIFLILIIFLREKQYDYARTAGILMLLPGSYLIGYLLTYFSSCLFGFGGSQILLVVNLLGILSSGLLIGVMACYIKRKRLRVVYCVTNGLYIAVIGVLMIFNTLYGIL